MKKEEIALELTKLVAPSVLHSTEIKSGDCTLPYAVTLTEVYNYFVNGINVDK